MTTAPPEPQPQGEPIVVSGTDFFGVRGGSPLGDADPVLQEATAVFPTGATSPPNVFACSSFGPTIWLTLLGGMYVQWEGESVETAQPSNWGYTGGAVVDGRAIVTDTGVTIGTRRDDVIAAYGGSVVDYGDELDAAGLRFRFQDGVVVFIGRIDCGD